MFPLLHVPLTWNDYLFDDFDADFDKMSSYFHTMPLSFPHVISTTCDVEDIGNEIVIKVDLPGVTKKDIKLDITENSIEISAEHKDESKKNNKTFLKRERTELSYYRVLPLPVKVLSGKAKAKLSDGVLSVTIPKANPIKQKKNSITIE